MRRVYVLQFRCCSLPECCVGYELQMCCGLSKLNWSSCGVQWRTVHCFCAYFQMEHLCHKLCLVFASATSIPHIKSIQWGSRTQLKSLQTQTQSPNSGDCDCRDFESLHWVSPTLCASASRSRMGKQAGIFYLVSIFEAESARCLELIAFQIICNIFSRVDIYHHYHCDMDGWRQRVRFCLLWFLYTL